MILDRVTMTGADDRVDIQDLEDISAEYPFVEWGILVDDRTLSNSSPRYPSLEWLKELPTIDFSAGLSCHVCGPWVQQILHGRLHPSLHVILAVFDRVQLNTHGEAHSINENGMDLLKNDIIFANSQVIFQNDEINFENYAKAKMYGANCVPLYDMSHGAGISPVKWVAPNAMYTGYAGGLGPKNLREELTKIQDVVGDARIWIDMETHVRTKGEFDLDKVTTCLKIAGEFIEA